jgi:flavin-dependent dehydrogenase
MDAGRVVIIGGGPAGTSAAITCAAAGLSVTLLERADFPRDAPGESLHPGVEALFERLGVADAVRAAGFVRYPGIESEWDGPARFMPFGEDAGGPWRGFQAWRAELDALLLARARAVGVEVLQPRRALHPLYGARGEVVGVETDAGALACRVLIDAAGGAHWLARHLGVAREEASPRLVATYGYVAEGADAPDAAPGRGAPWDNGTEPQGDTPRIIADDAGWTWTARVRPGVRQWTRLGFTGRPAPSGWRPPEVESLTPLGRNRGADVTWRRVVAPAGPGYLMVGDAAAVLDPASSHGVLKGLMSGMMAGHLISRVDAGALPWDAACASYTEWVRGWFEHDVAHLKERYRRFPGWAAAGSR